MKFEASNEFILELVKLLNTVSEDGNSVKRLLENTHSDDYDEYYTFCGTLERLNKFNSHIKSTININDQ